MTTVESLDPTPFRNLVTSIGILPSAYTEAMSYYELVAWLCNYIEKNVVTNLNNHAQAIKEIQDWIDTLDLQKYVNEKLDELKESGELVEMLLHYFSVDKSHIDLGTNLLTEASWTKGNGWTGNFNDGFTHTGGTATLSTSITVATGKLHVVKFTCTNQVASTTEQSLVVQFGGSPIFEQYRDDGTVTKYFTFYPENGDLVFTPIDSWNGLVYGIGVYEIDNDEILPEGMKVYDENDQVAYANTITDSDAHNILIGQNVMRYATTEAKENIAIGDQTLEKTATGYYNTAIGYQSQQDSIDGTRNVSVGYKSLQNVTYGDRNIAVGTFALNSNTTGQNNIAIGADAAWNTTTGSNNIAVANGALNSNTTGESNIAMGYFAGSGNTSGSQNIGIGYLSNNAGSTGVDNISLGYFSHYKGTGDRHNVSIGWQTMSQNTDTTSMYNIALGYQSMYKSAGSNNIAIGNTALKSPTTETSYNIAIGYDTMSQSVASASEGDNIVIGHSSGRNIAGVQNVVLGRGALNAAATNYNIALGNSALKDTTGTGNVAIGFGAGDYITSYNNTICIGYNAHGINRSNSVVIGECFQYNGEDQTMSLGKSVSPLSNTRLYVAGGDSTHVPIKLASGSLASSTVAGAIEYDGSHLYFTDSAGTRHQLSVVS